MEIKNSAEYNFYPLDIVLNTGEATPENPSTNISATPISNDNIIRAASGSVLIDGVLQSLNFVKGSSGWIIRASGTVELGDGVFRGTITATAGFIGGFTIDATTIYSAGNEIVLDSDNKRIEVGASDEIVIDGDNKKITVGASDEITIDGANKKIESGNYASGYAGSGFHIDENLAEFGNIACRGLIRTAVFQKDVVSIMGGNLAVLDGDVLDGNMTALDASTLKTKATTTFAVGDILRIKDGIDDEWMEIVSSFSSPSLKSPSTMADDSAAGTITWSDPDNAKTSNDSYATITQASGTNSSHYLKATNFGFAIPTGATITGIKVEAEIRAMTKSGDDYISSINGYMQKAGSNAGDNIGISSSDWETTDTYSSRGSDTDLWGTTWTPAEINNAGFGYKFNCAITGNNTGYVDHIRITVYYTPASGYVVNRDKGTDYATNTNPAWKKGVAVANYKQSGDGGIYLTASETNAPYFTIFTHAGAPWTTINERLRLGNLNGIGGFVADVYGAFIGDKSTGNYLSYDDDSGELIVGAAKIIKGYTTGVALTAGQAVLMHTDGKVYPTNARIVNVVNQFLGFCLKDTAVATTAPIQIFGDVTELSSLTTASVYYISNSTHSSDVTQNNSDTGNTALGTGYTNWQSFKPTGDTISQITINVSNAAGALRTYDVKLYSGEGIGTSLGEATSAAIPLGGAANDVSAVFDVPIAVTAGNTYTFSCKASGDCCKWSEQRGSDDYADGRDNNNSAYDYRFSTSKINSFGAIGTGAGTNSKKVGIATSPTTLALKDAI